MNEVNFFIYEEAIQPVVLALARLGTLQIEDESGGEASARQNHWTAIATTYATQERRLRELFEALELAPPVGLPPADIDLENNLAETDQFLAEVGQAVDAWRRAGAETAREQEQLRFLMEQMRLLAPLAVPVEQLTDLERLHLVVGTMPTANLARIQTALFRIPFVIIPAYTHADRTLVFAATAQEYGAILDRALRSAFFQPVALPDGVSGPPAAVLVECQRKVAAAQQREEELKTQRGQLLSRWGEPLGVAWNRVQASRKLAETIQHLPNQGEVYVIAGWVPARRLQETIATVQAATNGRAIIEVLEPEAARPQVPTQLRNPRLLQAFEALVTNFGFPAYDELDPTLVVTVTFLLMFGIMFGDVAHGLLLALAGVWLATRKGNLARFSPVLILSGLSAAVFGLIYGTVLGTPRLPALWLRPAENITSILVAALVVGIVLLNVGFGLYLYTNWRTRNWSRFLLDSNGLAGVALDRALLGGGIALWLGILTPALWGLLVLAPAAVLFLREPLRRWQSEGRLRPHGSWGEYAVLAFFELFETVISFAGNSLSFVRLGAFAVAHEGLSQVVLLMAGLSGGLGWLVILLGTIFIVAFEGLIVGIQTLRLEYYEFFGKFFRGDGRAFKPLRLPATDS